MQPKDTNKIILSIFRNVKIIPKTIMKLGSSIIKKLLPSFNVDFDEVEEFDGMRTRQERLMNYALHNILDCFMNIETLFSSAILGAIAGIIITNKAWAILAGAIIVVVIVLGIWFLKHR